MTLEELGKKVQAVEDLEEIKKMHHDYIFLLCDKQCDQMLEFFAKDATAQINAPYVCKGKEEIARHFREVIAKRGAPKGGSILVMPVITVDGDKAKGYWTMYRFFGNFEALEIPPWKWVQER